MRISAFHALGTRTEFQLEIHKRNNVIYSIIYFRKIILERSWNVSEKTPSWLRAPSSIYDMPYLYHVFIIT